MVPTFWPGSRFGPRSIRITLDEIAELPADFRILARTAGCEIQAIAAPERRWWGTQFHPERFDSGHPDGRRVIANFFELAGRAEPVV